LTLLSALQVRDLEASLKDGRLRRQIGELRACGRAVVLVEGPVSTPLRCAAVRYLVSVEGLAVSVTKDSDETLELLKRWARHGTRQAP